PGSSICPTVLCPARWVWPPLPERLKKLGRWGRRLNWGGAERAAMPLAPCGGLAAVGREPGDPAAALGRGGDSAGTALSPSAAPLRGCHRLSRGQELSGRAPAPPRGAERGWPGAGERRAQPVSARGQLRSAPQPPESAGAPGGQPRHRPRTGEPRGLDRARREPSAPEGPGAAGGGGVPRRAGSGELQVRWRGAAGGPRCPAAPGFLVLSRPASCRLYSVPAETRPPPTGFSREGASAQPAAARAALPVRPAPTMRLNSSAALSGLEAALLALGWGNGSGNASEPLSEQPSGDLDVNTDVYSKVLVTAVYLVLFVVGTAGNSVTAFTLARKKSLQHLQSTVHYHLGSLAASDLLILLLAMPVELYNFIWVHHPWAFGDAGCRGYYFLRDACTFATALNVASLSVERYLAICHPFKAKTLMSRSRTRRLIGAIWLASGLLALPMLFTMGQQNRSADGRHPGGLVCTPVVGAATVKAVIQINTFTSFVFPMAAISVLNTVIANKLTIMARQAAEQGQACAVGDQPGAFSMAVEPGRIQALRHGVRVLRAVVVAFVVCLLPYHVRRLMFCYISEKQWTPFLYDFYHYFYMLTNVLFYVSSTVNPILYNLVSARFRQVFLSTLACLCPVLGRRRDRPAFARKTNSVSSNHTLSSHATRESLY
ncbi:Neurotensin receptor type 1, partial [Galemys pyrenaicus]